MTEGERSDLARALLPEVDSTSWHLLKCCCQLNLHSDSCCLTEQIFPTENAEAFNLVNYTSKKDPVHLAS